MPTVSDTSLRELERRFRASNNVEDEITWLRARLRAGDLGQSKLELACYLGSQSASAVLGRQAPKYTKPPKTGVNGWVRQGLAVWGPLPLLRAAIAATRMIISDDDDLPETVGRIKVHLAEAYAVEQRPEILKQHTALPRNGAPAPGRWQDLWRACYYCGSTLAFIDREDTLPAWKAKDTVEHVAKVVGSAARVRAAIVAELLPWALGYSDPVRERVEARQRQLEADGA